VGVWELAEDLTPLVYSVPDGFMMRWNGDSHIHRVADFSYEHELFFFLHFFSGWGDFDIGIVDVCLLDMLDYQPINYHTCFQS
jgi:hypothetical protein